MFILCVWPNRNAIVHATQGQWTQKDFGRLLQHFSFLLLLSKWYYLCLGLLLFVVLLSLATFVPHTFFVYPLAVWVFLFVFWLFFFSLDLLSCVHILLSLLIGHFISRATWGQTWMKQINVNREVLNLRFVSNLASFFSYRLFSPSFLYSSSSWMFNGFFYVIDGLKNLCVRKKNWAPIYKAHVFSLRFTWIRQENSSFIEYAAKK